MNNIKREVMIEAWKKFRANEHDTFASCLRAAWAYVKAANSANDVAKSFNSTEYSVSVVSEFDSDLRFVFTKKINSFVPYSAFKKAEQSFNIEKGDYDASTKSIFVNTISFSVNGYGQDVNEAFEKAMKRKSRVAL